MSAGSERGSASVEFVCLGLLLLIPLVYLVLVLGRLQAASFATDSAARAGARAFSSADADASGRSSALAAVRLALADQGFDVDPGQATQVACSGTPCLTPSGRVVVRVGVQVHLPGLPARLDRLARSHLSVHAEQVATVDAFRTAGR